MRIDIKRWTRAAHARSFCFSFSLILSQLAAIVTFGTLLSPLEKFRDHRAGLLRSVRLNELSVIPLDYEPLVDDSSTLRLRALRQDPVIGHHDHICHFPIFVWVFFF